MTSGHTPRTMPRCAPAMLLVLVVVAGCAPAEADEPPRALMVTAPPPTIAPARTDAPAPVDPPTARANVDPSPAPGSSSPSATPAPTASPKPSTEHAADKTDSPSSRMSVNLARVADFAPQYTFDWCVGASLQMARSIVTGDRNESRRSQRRLWQMARDRSPDSPYGGANPIGWAATLNDLGLGRYRFLSLPTFDAAVRTAARAIAETRRPVGLVMWAGRHAWVMTGFESNGDPRRDEDAAVTRVRVMDPLYPHGSRWGPSPAPNSLVRLKQLARQFVLRDRPDYDLGVAPGWLLVLPVD